jgi:hypothetical protein
VAAAGGLTWAERAPNTGCGGWWALRRVLVGHCGQGGCRHPRGIMGVGELGLRNTLYVPPKMFLDARQ